MNPLSLDISRALLRLSSIVIPYQLSNTTRSEAAHASGAGEGCGTS
jgi:hypothetical protein